MEHMKYDCPACGAYVGAGHRCYEPAPSLPTSYLTPDGEVKPAVVGKIEQLTYPISSRIPGVLEQLEAMAEARQASSTWTDADWLNAHRKANQQLAEQVGRLTNLLQDAWRERDQALALAESAVATAQIGLREQLAVVERLKVDHASAIRQLTGQEEGSVG